jgi:hypothetical protein
LISDDDIQLNYPDATLLNTFEKTSPANKTCYPKSLSLVLSADTFAGISLTIFITILN